MPAVVRNPDTPGLLEMLRQVGGEIDPAELRYQAEQRGVRIRETDIDALVSEGLLERTPKGGLQAETSIASTGGAQLEAIRRRMATRENDRAARTSRTKQPIRRRSRSGNHPWSRPQVLAAIRLYVEVTGAPPRKADWNAAVLRERVEQGGARARESEARLALYALGIWPCETTVRKLFGTLNAAVEAAGFTPRRRGRPPRAPSHGRVSERDIVADLFNARERAQERAGKVRLPRERELRVPAVR